MEINGVEINKAVFAPENYFELRDYAHKELFEGLPEVWQAFSRLEAYVRKLIEAIPEGERIKGEVREGAKIYGRDVVIEEGVLVEGAAYIRGPVYLGKKTIIGPGAFLRGPVLTGEGCIIGNSTEAKNTIMLNRAFASHFNYIGDSMLGSEASLGAGAHLANTKITGSSIRVGDRDTSLVRFGAVLGDGVKLGCSVVCDPGTLIGKACLILPLTYVRAGVYERGEEKFALRKIL